MAPPNETGPPEEGRSENVSPDANNGKPSGMSWQECRDLAAKLTDSGIPCFPIGIKFSHDKGKTEKRPTTEHGHHDATVDADNLADLFARYVKLGPGEWPGVGAYPGPAGFLVLDVDDLDTLEALEAEHGEVPGRRVRTASGGLHIWQRLPEGVAVAQSSPWKGIDIRSSRGWVVAPGVRSPWGGWTAEGGELAEAPRWVLDAILKHEKAPREIPDEAEPGDRHEALVSLAASMWARGLARSAVLAAIRGYNAEQCKPPKPDSELVEIVEWIVQQDGGPRPDWRILLHDDKATGGTLADLLAEEIEPIRFVIDGLIPEGLSMLAGKPKIGKSRLMLTMSLGICAGEQVLDHRTQPAEILYIALEDGKRRLQSQVRELGGTRIDREALDRFHYRNEWPTLDAGGLDQLEKWMTDHPDTRLIVIDTYGKVRGGMPGKDRYAEEYQLLGKVQSFATAHRVAIVLIHHLRKQGADDWLEQLSGSQAITGAADTLLGLFRERGQMDATLRLVSREVEEKDLALKFDAAGRWESMGDAALYRQSVERTAILEGIRDLGGEAKVSDVASLVDKKTGTVSKLLIKLAEEGLVRKAAYGVYALSPSVEPVDVVEPTSTTSTTSTTPVRGSKKESCVFCREPATHHSGPKARPVCDVCQVIA